MRDRFGRPSRASPIRPDPPTRAIHGHGTTAGVSIGICSRGKPPAPLPERCVAGSGLGAALVLAFTEQRTTPPEGQGPCSRAFRAGIGLIIRVGGLRRRVNGFLAAAERAAPRWGLGALQQPDSRQRARGRRVDAGRGRQRPPVAANVALVGVRRRQQQQRLRHVLGKRLLQRRPRVNHPTYTHPRSSARHTHTHTGAPVANLSDVCRARTARLGRWTCRYMWAKAAWLAQNDST